MNLVNFIPGKIINSEYTDRRVRSIALLSEKP